MITRNKNLKPPISTKVKKCSVVLNEINPKHLSTVKSKNIQNKCPTNLKIKEKDNSIIPEKVQNITTNKKVINNNENLSDKPKKTNLINDDTDYNFNESHINEKMLRERKKIDYKDRNSTGTPDISLQRTETKVPIYKRENLNEKPVLKRKNNPFEFIPESDDDKDSDISFHISVPKKRKVIRHKKEPQKIPKVNKNTNVKPINYTYAKKMNDLLHKLGNSIEKKKKNLEKSGNESSSSIDTSDIAKGGLEDMSPVNNEKVNESCMINPSRIEVEDDDNYGFDDNFDSDNNEEDLNTKENGRITIISDVTLNKSIPLNRSSIKQLSINKASSPWRYNNDLITRNPHWIEVKQNGLPNLNQEPVLDYTFDENISKHNTTLIIPEKKKELKQTTLHNFIESDKENIKETVQKQSLFDIEDLSPLKINDRNRNKGFKRNILSQISTNETSTPNKNKQPLQLNLSLIDKDENINNFGFDESSEIINENLDVAAKPFRVSISTKKYKRKLPDKIMKPVRDSEIKKLITDETDFENIIEKDNLDVGNVGLFEDIEVPSNLGTNCIPRTKKKLFKNQNVHKEKKTYLSKDAKEWIKSFNEMCKEVDDVQLEVE